MIYILTRLFNINDRKVSLNLYNAIMQWIDEHEIPMRGGCFLPYRDSNDKVKNLENKTEQIFSMDCKTIENSEILVGHCDGPMYDSGIGFEIGYAFSLEIPVVLLTTDYFFSEYKGLKCSISPLANRISEIIHVREDASNSSDYQESLSNIENVLLKGLKDRLNSVCFEKRITEIKEVDIYIDSEFVSCEASSTITNKLINLIKKSTKSFYIATRNDVETNLKYLYGCRMVLIWGETFDMDIDSAITQGLAYGLRKKIVVFSGNKKNYVQSESFVLYKNPMIEHSAIIVSNIKGLYKEIEN